jgi:hypothetical protein
MVAYSDCGSWWEQQRLAEEEFEFELELQAIEHSNDYSLDDNMLHECLSFSAEPEESLDSATSIELSRLSRAFLFDPEKEWHHRPVTICA